MKKVGRPKSENPKNTIIRIRLSESEYDMLKNFAEKLNVPITEVVRRGIKSYCDLGEK